MRAPAALAFIFYALACGLGACGGNVDTPGADSPGQGRAPVFVMDARSCQSQATPTAEEAVRAEDASDRLAVVELFFQDECSGAGGNWVLARELDGTNRFFLGAHACWIWKTPPTAPFGVVRYRQTAGLFSTPKGWCIAFAGEQFSQTSLSTSGVVAFETRADAESFARRFGWTKPGG